MRVFKKIVVLTMVLMLAMSGVVTPTSNRAQASTKKTIVRGVKKYKKCIPTKMVREALGVPNEAKVTITYYEKTYHSGTGYYEIPVIIRGRGKYKKYIANAHISFSEIKKGKWNGIPCCSIVAWYKQG